LVIPAILYSIDGDEGSENDLEMSLGKVSVVQIALAHAIQWSCDDPKLSYAFGTLSMILSIGSL
jgi:hypothetical protein